MAVFSVTEPRAFSVGPPGLVTSGDPIRSAAAQSSSSPSQPPPQSTSSDIGAPTSTATANDQQRIQQQLLQHQAHAAAVAALAASQQQSVSQLPCGAGGGVANATPEQIDAATPRCLVSSLKWFCPVLLSPYQVLMPPNICISSSPSSVHHT